MAGYVLYKQSHFSRYFQVHNCKIQKWGYANRYQLCIELVPVLPTPILHRKVVFCLLLKKLYLVIKDFHQCLSQGLIATPILYETLRLFVLPRSMRVEAQSRTSHTHMHTHTHLHTLSHYCYQNSVNINHTTSI